jgi:hypothetical protein
MWNPSSSKLKSVEDDEAGRLAAFRAKFGRNWDATAAPEDSAAAGGDKDKEDARKAAQKEAEEEDDNLLDLISSFGQEEVESGKKK